MDRRTLLAIVLCFLIFLGWQKFYLEKHMPAAPSAQTAQTTGSTTGVAVSPGAPATQTNTAQGAPTETKQVPLSTGVAIVGNGNKFFTGWDLKSYRLGLAPEAAAVDLKSVTHEQGEGSISFDLPEFAYLSNVQGTLSETPQGAIWTYEDENVKLVREMTGSREQPFVDVKLSAEFKNKRPNYAFVSLASKSPSEDPEAQDRNLVYWTKDAIEKETVSDTIDLQEVATPVQWIGATNRYFLMSLVDSQGTAPKALLQPLGEKEGRISLVYPLSENAINVSLKAYFGPKDLELLRVVTPTLDHVVDFGWFTLFAYPLLKIMKWFYGIFHNYGVAIILLTLLVKLLTYPLTYKSMKSMKQMSALQPQLAKLREKHKDDKEALNREMLTMMRTHGYNPMAGCLPIVIQMPVFFALYRVLYSSIELYHAPFMFWIQDLSAKDPYYVTPVLLSATMFIQQKLTPNTATDPAQQKMMQMMPLIFGLFMVTLPSGLTVYMLVNAIASIVQQMILNKKLDIKHVPAVATR